MDGDHNHSLKDLWVGIATAIGIYVVFGILFMMIIGIMSLVVAFAVDLVFIIVSFIKGRKQLGQGLLIGLGIVILLLAACYGMIFLPFSG